MNSHGAAKQTDPVLSRNPEATGSLRLMAAYPQIASVPRQMLLIGRVRRVTGKAIAFREGQNQ
jgi:hypothetical protein